MSELQHIAGEVHAIEFKAFPERQEVRPVSTAYIEQFALLPALRQRFQLGAEYRPVPEVIPPRGYLVENFSGHPIPLIPFPSRGRGEFFKRGEAPLGLSLQRALIVDIS